MVSACANGASVRYQPTRLIEGGGGWLAPSWGHLCGRSVLRWLGGRHGEAHRATSVLRARAAPCRGEPELSLSLASGRVQA